MSAPIQLLDPTLINQIAAGEVIERPASILKELIENALDAGANKIDIHIRSGGKTYIQVRDNGPGMDAQDLGLCIQRHATSKLPDGNLFDIHSFGFRGEALPSIGSVSRLTLCSRTAEETHGWELSVEGGAVITPKPIQTSTGTTVTVRDLFFATPARLHFLKSDQNEYLHCAELVKRLALAHAHVQWHFKSDERVILNLEAQTQLERATSILGEEWARNAIEVYYENIPEGMKLKGLISLPTFHKSTAADQFIYVNKRPIKDKNINALLRVAYQDVLAHGRHPVVVLFLELACADVDVNVHPAKTEVRFRYNQEVRRFIIQGLQRAITSQSKTASSHIATQTYQSFERNVQPVTNAARFQYQPSMRVGNTGGGQAAAMSFQPTPMEDTITLPVMHETANIVMFPLGQARAQIDATYIISETQNALILVDQHAAHERIVYEKLKTDFASKKIPQQRLLLPEVVSLSEAQYAAWEQHQNLLRDMGFEVEAFGKNALQIMQIPQPLKDMDISMWIRDVLDDLHTQGDSTRFQEHIFQKLATHACHHSIRSGRVMSLSEMNALLRQMEQTDFSAQCNHGRPTYITLSKKEIEALFERR